jgi:hypothetical protein
MKTFITMSAALQKQETVACPQKPGTLVACPQNPNMTLDMVYG